VAGKRARGRKKKEIIQVHQIEPRILLIWGERVILDSPPPKRKTWSQFVTTSPGWTKSKAYWRRLENE
jgi:hypothetical protein